MAALPVLLTIVVMIGVWSFARSGQPFKWSAAAIFAGILSFGALFYLIGQSGGLMQDSIGIILLGTVLIVVFTVGIPAGAGGLLAGALVGRIGFGAIILGWMLSLAVIAAIGAPLIVWIAG